MEHTGYFLRIASLRPGALLRSQTWTRSCLPRIRVLHGAHAFLPKSEHRNAIWRIASIKWGVNFWRVNLCGVDFWGVNCWDVNF